MMISRTDQAVHYHPPQVPSRPGAKLSVFLHDEPVGTLERRGPARYRFGYSAEGLAVGRALSLSLPLRPEGFSPSDTAPFFEGLLPEGPVRAALAEKFRISERDGFGMLEALGAECAGAVAVLPKGELPGPEAEAVRSLDEDGLAKLIEDLPRNPLGVGLDGEGVRLSLGGVQQKLVLVRTASGQFGQPLRGPPSTCLIKPERGFYEDLAANEAFCMRVAAASGLEVARTELLTVGPTRCLYVERFDRAAAGGRIVRLHQEDMCQALGILPEAKYEASGGPSAARIVALLRGSGSRRAALDVNAFVQAVLVNFLLGNSDAHGKNFSMLYDPEKGLRLAPLYDIVSTAVYPELVSRMAMAIGEGDDPRGVDLGSWEQLGDVAGLGGQLTGFVRHWASQVREGAEGCRREALAEGWHRPVIDEIVDLCRERSARLING
jgi:serine/threonine-protein kinase HipA